MLKIQRKQFLSDNPYFPQSNYRTDKYIYPDVYDSYKLTLNSKSAKGHARLLSLELARLLMLMGFRKIRFLGDTNIPWLFRDHDYKPVKAALDYLKEQKVSKTFAGALELNITELTDFFKNLYWLVRGNGVVNYIYFDDEKSNIIASLCQYGSVHFSTLNEESDLIFNRVLADTKFIDISDNESCFDPFSNTSAIKGMVSTVL